MLVPLFRPLCTLTEVHMRRRVIQLLELRLAQTLVRRKDGLALDVLQLRHPFADEITLGVGLLLETMG
jgi:hypothetical protein